MEAQKSGTGLKKVFIGFLIALAATNGVTLYFLLSENHQKNIVIVEKTSLEQDYKNVTDALDSKKTEIEQLRGKNDEMDKLINEKEKLIEDEKNQLAEQYSKNELTTAELNKARKLIGDYEMS